MTVRRYWNAARLGVLAAIVQTSTAAGQEPPILSVGDSVRLRAPTLTMAPVTGTYLGTTGSEVLLSGIHGEPRRIPLSAVTELRQRRGLGRNLLSGVAMGYFGGGLVVELVGAAAGKSETDSRRLTAIGGLVGGLVGGIVGQLHQTPRWEPLSLTTIRPAVVPGTQVRVTALRLGQTGPITGVVDSTTSEGLFLRTRAGPVTVARDEVQLVEWPYRQKRATGRGAGIGAVVGGLGGAVVGGLAGGSCEGEWLCPGAAGGALIGAAFLGITGAATGGVIGYFSRITVWEHPGASPTRITVRPVVSLHRIGLGGSVSF